MNSSENSPQDLIKYVPSAYFTSVYATERKREREEKNVEHFMLFEFNVSARVFVVSPFYFSMHNVIVSLCDVVLLVNVNAFDDTCCALFSTHTWNVVVNPDSKTTTKSWTALFLPHITSHAHQRKATIYFFFRLLNTFICSGIFFFVRPVCHYFSWIFWNFDTQHNGIQSKCMQILKFAWIPLYQCMCNFQLDLKLD